MGVNMHDLNQRWSPELPGGFSSWLKAGGKKYFENGAFGLHVVREKRVNGMNKDTFICFSGHGVTTDPQSRQIGFHLMAPDDVSRLGPIPLSLSFSRIVERSRLFEVIEPDDGDCFFLVSARAQYGLTGLAPPRSKQAVNTPDIIKSARQGIHDATIEHIDTLVATLCQFGPATEEYSQMRANILEHAKSILTSVPDPSRPRENWGGGEEGADMLVFAILHGVTVYWITRDSSEVRIFYPNGAMSLHHIDDVTVCHNGIVFVFDGIGHFDSWIHDAIENLDTAGVQVDEPPAAKKAASEETNQWFKVGRNRKVAGRDPGAATGRGPADNASHGPRVPLPPPPPAASPLKVAEVRARFRFYGKGYRVEKTPRPAAVYRYTHEAGLLLLCCLLARKDGASDLSDCSDGRGAGSEDGSSVDSDLPVGRMSTRVANGGGRAPTRRRSEARSSTTGVPLASSSPSGPMAVRPPPTTTPTP